MPPIISEKRMMAAWSSLASAWTTYVSNASSKPRKKPSGENDRNAVAPSHMPIIKAGITFRSKSAIRIATNGGEIETHPGSTLILAETSSDPGDEASKSTLPEVAATISVKTAFPSASARETR
ncbi:MAG TPA: hypothetical protein VLS27_07785, partial [Gammaproteobacteria bacterium]|nr:hypothetical protein [Gammaproteobacteria bacterium]